MASGWKRRFDELIPPPRGRQLVTLEDAAKYIQKLPAAEQRIAEWQGAVEVLHVLALLFVGKLMRTLPAPEHRVCAWMAPPARHCSVGRIVDKPMLGQLGLWSRN